jgi:hypothetical protein
MIQDTSLHPDTLLAQNLTDRQKEVLGRLRCCPDVTNMELAVSMNWPGGPGFQEGLECVTPPQRRPLDALPNRAHRTTESFASCAAVSSGPLSREGALERRMSVRRLSQ